MSRVLSGQPALSGIGQKAAEARLRNPPAELSRRRVAVPAEFTARTWKLWRPRLTLCLKGERQGLKGSLSSLHWKVEPGWSEEKVKVAVRLVVLGRGFFFRVVFGAA